MGVSHRCVCVKLSTKGGIAPFLGSANLPYKVSRDMGYRSDSIAVSRDMGPLSMTPLVCALKREKTKKEGGAENG